MELDLEYLLLISIFSCLFISPMIVITAHYKRFIRDSIKKFFISMFGKAARKSYFETFKWMVTKKKKKKRGRGKGGKKGAKGTKIHVEGKDDGKRGKKPRPPAIKDEKWAHASELKGKKHKDAVIKEKVVHEDGSTDLIGADGKIIKTIPAGGKEEKKKKHHKKHKKHHHHKDTPK
jgi:hypothetical protein